MWKRRSSPNLSASSRRTSKNRYTGFSLQTEDRMAVRFDRFFRPIIPRKNLEMSTMFYLTVEVMNSSPISYVCVSFEVRSCERNEKWYYILSLSQMAISLAIVKSRYMRNATDFVWKKMMMTFRHYFFCVYTFYPNIASVARRKTFICPPPTSDRITSSFTSLHEKQN